MLSEQISRGIAKVEIELSEPGEYYLCFQHNSVESGQNRTKVHKQWLHQGSNYHVSLKVSDRLMPIPLQISLIVLCLVLSGTFSGNWHFFNHQFEKLSILLISLFRIQKKRTQSWTNVTWSQWDTSHYSLRNRIRETICKDNCAHTKERWSFVVALLFVHRLLTNHFKI